MSRSSSLVLCAVAVVLWGGCLGSNPNTGNTGPLVRPRAAATVSLTPPAFGTPQTSYPLTVQRSDGKAFTIRARPSRIVTLAPALTEMVFAVGAQDALVSVDSASDYPSRAADLSHVGSGPSSAAAVAALHPDLVLVAGDDSQTIAALDGMGVPVFSLNPPATLVQVLQQLQFYGDLTGHPAGGQQAAARLRARIDAVQRRLRDVSTGPRAYIELGPQPLAATDASLAGDILTTLKAPNAVSGSGRPTVPVTVDSLVAANPEVILLADASDGVTPDAVKSRPGWSAIAAVSSGRVYAVDAQLVTRPGPRAVDGLEALAKILYPDRF